MRLGHTCWCTVVSVKRLMWLRLASCSTRMIDVVFSSVLRESSLRYERLALLYGRRGRDLHSG
jgi:predicted nuclease of predicted toxin-antitoxin system